MAAERKSMLKVLTREGLSRVVDPVGAALVRTGLSPDAVTVAGTAFVVLSSIFLVTQGHAVAGLIIITLSALTDMLDGAMARAANRTSRWGAFLDSTCDRLSDGSIFAATAYWMFDEGRNSAGAAALCALVFGVLVSYARARAEGLGLKGDVGLAERTERLIILGVGGLLEILGVRWGLEAVLWLIAALALFTVGQRVRYVWVQTHRDTPAPDPDDGREHAA
jgi:CDP-diacylglycerol--glycerol-3-phosphate 3-phosphatidyltransferase